MGLQRCKKKKKRSWGCSCRSVFSVSVSIHINKVDIRGDEWKLAPLSPNIISHKEPGSEENGLTTVKQDATFLLVFFYAESSVDVLTWLCDFYSFSDGLFFLHTYISCARV